MYAILDIESSGSKYSAAKIIEIAIYRYDGEMIIDQFSTLVNPNKKIDSFVVQLTGITDKMIVRAPQFHEVAKRIVEITQDAIIVAHNAAFDYKLLKAEFLSLGYTYDRKYIDTISVSKKLIPDAESYSLGNLTKSLGIILKDRHRAFGDAYATVSLFQLLLEKDVNKQIVKKFIQNKGKIEYSPRIIDLLKNLPHKIGVFYLFNQKGKLIYIGKSNDIASDLRQFFISSNKKIKAIAEKVFNIKYEITGSELLSVIKTFNEINALKPRYNKVLDNQVHQYGIFINENSSPYKALEIRKKIHYKNQNPLLELPNKKMAYDTLCLISENFELCKLINKLESNSNSCYEYPKGICKGACAKIEDSAQYNQRFEKALECLHFKNENFLITDKGREPKEKTFFKIEDKKLIGYGFYKYQHEIDSEEKLRKRMTQIKESHEILQTLKNLYLKQKMAELS